MEVLAVTTLLLLTVPIGRKTKMEIVSVQVLRGLSYWLTVTTSVDGAGARLQEDRAG